jgi:autotransporter-associated beta strand protein
VTGDSTSLVAGTGGSLGTAAVTVNTGRRLTLSRSDTHTVANTISGAGVVHVGATGITGSNTQDLTLSGTNSYSGGTELLQGTLRVAALSGIGSGHLAVKNGSTFAYTGSGAETTTRNLFLDLGAARIDVTDASGSLTWNDAAAKTGTFTKGGAGSLSLGGVISSTASVTVAGGSLSLTGTNTYTGTTTISAGTLALGNGGTTGSVADASAIDIAAGALLIWNRSTSDTGFGNAISGAGTLRKTGAGELGLTGTNAFTGLLDIQAGKIGLSSATSVAGSPSVSVASGATLSLGTGFSGGVATIGNLSGQGLVDAAFGGSNDTRTLSVGQTTAGEFSGTLANANNGRVLAITKAGPAALSLAAGGTYTYTGATTVTAGTLLANGVLTGTSGVVVDAGATLGGSGRINAGLSGAGLVSPGSSPGILAATVIDPAAGTDYAFEFIATGSPTYGSASASVNDVLRLTAATPFTASLTAANAIDVYFDIATIAASDTFKGAFYADTRADFLPSIQGAAFAYWVKGDGTGTERFFNGQGYFSLASYDAGLTVNVSTLAESAAFTGGAVNGQVTQFVVVPEPGSLAVAAVGLGLAWLVTAHGRRRAGRCRSGGDVAR